MFYKFGLKLKLMLIPISIIVFMLLVVVYFSFFNIMQKDYSNKSEQLTEHIAKSIAYQLDKTKGITESLIITYHLDDILQTNATLGNINRCLSRFKLYDPAVQTVILCSDKKIYSDGNYSSELITSLNSSLHLAPLEHKYMINPIDNRCVVYAKRLSELEQYIYVISVLDSKKLYQQDDTVFTNYSYIYLSFDNNGSFTILNASSKQLKETDYTVKPNKLHSGRLILSSDIPGYPAKIYTVQSSSYLNLRFIMFLAILIVIFILTLIVCRICTLCIIKIFSVELETLNNKLQHGAYQIYELTE